ncbi:MAG: hypothetical protein ACI86H_003037, partial [bacterium]
KIKRNKLYIGIDLKNCVDIYIIFRLFQNFIVKQ